MNLLRYFSSINEETPEEAIEYFVVDAVRAGVDGGTFMPSRETLTTKFKLDSVFEKVFNDPVQE